MSIVNTFGRGRNARATDLYGGGSRSIHAKSVTLEMVIECHKRNPRWSATDIARSLGSTPDTVHKLMRRSGLILPGATFGNHQRRRDGREL